jgi:hypothetical protein
MSLSHSPKIVTDGLVLYLDAANIKSYPGSGTQWKDLSGLGNHATLVNGPTYSSLNKGNFIFDGTNDYTSFNTPVSNLGPYSIIQWLCPMIPLVASGYGTNKPSGANRKTTIVGPGPVWNPGIWVNSDYLRVHAKTQYIDVRINWTTTVWAMLGMTFNGINCQAFFNGILLPAAYTTSYAPPSLTQLYIGAESSGGSSVNWNGKIGITQLYNRVLSQLEITQNFNALRGRYGL